MGYLWVLLLGPHNLSSGPCVDKSPSCSFRRRFHDSWPTRIRNYTSYSRVGLEPKTSQCLKQSPYHLYILGHDNLAVSFLDNFQFHCLKCCWDPPTDMISVHLFMASVITAARLFNSWPCRGGTRSHSSLWRLQLSG